MRHSGKLLVITNYADAIFQQNVIAGASDVANRHGYDVIVESREENASNSSFLASLELVDAVLVIANVLSDEELRDIHQFGLPVTLVSHIVPEVSVPAVVSDNKRGIAQLVNHLVNDCGRSQIAFIQGDMEQRDGIKRDQAFRNELVRHDLNVNDAYFLKGNFEPRLAAQSVRLFLERNVDFDALLASDYLMAVNAITELQEVGLRVPEDICVVGFGDGYEAEKAGLTVVAADIVEVGRRGARQLIGQIEGLHIQGLTILSTTLIERNSTLRVNEPVSAN